MFDLDFNDDDDPQHEGVFVGEIGPQHPLRRPAQNAAAAAAELSDHEEDDDLAFDEDVLIFDSDIHNNRETYFESLEDYHAREQSRYVAPGIISVGLHREGMPDPRNYNIFSACKAGDLRRVKYLVEVEDVDINRPDLFDSIPLFYACLCGHPHIVKYLLDKGAKLDSSTFVGARCYYGALDDNIRQLLRSYQAKPSEIDKLADAFEQIIAKNPNTPFADFEFVVQDRPIRVHRLFVMCHCEYFQKLLSTAPWIWKNRLRFKDSKRVRYHAFLAFIRYLYTDQLQLEIDTPDMESLLYILEKVNMLQLRGSVVHCIEQAKKRRMKQVILRPRQKSSRLKEVSRKVYLDLLKRRSKSHPDLLLRFSCQNGEPTEIKAHRSILWSRSEYFKVLLTGGFQDSEALNSDKHILIGLEEGSSWNLIQQKQLHQLDVLSLQNTSPDIVQAFLEFVYTGDIQHVQKYATSNREDIPEDVMDEESSFWYQMLLVSEIYIMQDLKFFCLRQLCKLVCLSTLWKILSVGMHHGSKRVIDACMDYIRSHVRTVYTSGEFAELLESNEPIAMELKQLIEDELPALWEYMLKVQDLDDEQMDFLRMLATARHLQDIF